VLQVYYFQSNDSTVLQSFYFSCPYYRAVQIFLSILHNN